MEKYHFNIQLEKVTLNNFRGFDQVSIDFDKNLTVFIGINGSGKSTIIELVSEIFRQLINRLYGKSPLQYFLSNTKDIKIGTTDSVNKIWFNLSYYNYDDIGQYVKDSGSDICTYWLTKGRVNNFDILNTEENADMSNSDLFSKVFSELYINQYEKCNVPVLAYYPFGNLSQKDDFNELDFGTASLNIYDDLLSDENINFGKLKAWLEWQQKRDMQRRIQNKNSQENALLSEEVFKNALEMLNDPEESIYQNIYIDWETKRQGEFVIEKNGNPLRENQLSSGEKLIFTLVADISTKLAIANPSSENPSKEGQGVVLIDEIDLHLHPKWQRKVVTKLREIFPNVQFVITTHSPLVLNHIPSKHVRSLEDGKVFGVSETEGQSSEIVLEDVMQTPASKYKKEFEMLYEFITQNNLTKAKEHLLDLETKIEGKHPEIVKINNLLKKKELLGQ